MSSFTETLQYEPVEGRPGVFRITKTFRFYYDDSLTGLYAEVQAGDLFNGASIPWLFQKLFNWKPMDSRWVQCAALHDNLVGEWGPKIPILNSQDSGYSKFATWAQAANWFKKALAIKTNHDPSILQWLFVSGVRIYGFIRDFK